MTQTHRVIGYSERGLVNALVHHALPISQAESFIQSVLKLVEWNGWIPPWSTSENIVATLYVETGFGPYFGDPDLIIVLEDVNKEAKYLIFIEAKITKYEKSARNEDYSSLKKGFNSSINGQLILKYRLAQTLASYRIENKKLVEPECIAASYQKMMKDTPKRTAFPSKGNLLRELVPQLKVSTDISNYAYIALTKDETNPFANIQHAPGQPYPVYYEAGNQLCKEAWERTGWLSWDKISKMLSSASSFCRGCPACKEFEETWELTF